MITADSFQSKPQVKLFTLSNGEDVYLRMIGWGERKQWQNAWEATSEDKVTEADFHTSLVVKALCDPDGKRLFTDDTNLQDAPAWLVGEIFALAFEYNKFGRKAVVEAKKNS